MASHGLFQASTFTEHMSPDIEWLPNAAYDQAFSDLMEEAHMAGYTKSPTDDSGENHVPYPGYISVSFDGGDVLITVRADPTITGATDAVEAVEAQDAVEAQEEVRDDEGNVVTPAVEGKPAVEAVEAQDAKPGTAEAGETVQLRIPRGEWDKLYNEVTREGGLPAA
jgi:hypothetical protein